MRTFFIRLGVVVAVSGGLTKVLNLTTEQFFGIAGLMLVGVMGFATLFSSDDNPTRVGSTSTSMNVDYPPGLGRSRRNRDEDGDCGGGSSGSD